jgi:hypothetical protein
MDQIEEQTSTPENPESAARRDFLKKVGRASATAPAVGLLLAASFKADRALGYDAGGSGGSTSGGSGSDIGGGSS